MAANFQQMPGAGQMMQQQQQRQQQQGQQQRPNQNSGGPTGQIQQLIFHSLHSNTGPLTGWQAGVLIQERIGLIFNIIGNLRLASQHQPNPPPLQKMIEIGIKFEKDIFEKSADRDEYKRQVQDKLAQLLERRAQNQAGLQQSIQIQAQAQAQQMMMNPSALQGQVQRQMPQQSGQQGFHQLQHQMQASPIPGQQLQQLSMGGGLSNDGLPQNMSQQQQFQMSIQQQQQPPQQGQNPAGRSQNVGPSLGQADTAAVNDLTNRLMASASPEEKAQIRMGMQNQMDPQTMQKYQAQGMDPIIMYFRRQAMQKYRADKQAHMLQAQAQAQAQAQLNGSQQQSHNIPTTAPPMQQQRSMNPSPLNGQTQPPTSVSGNPDFGFMGNMGNIIDQQQQGVIAQEAGQMVFPASSAQRNATPQPGIMAGHQMNMNDQRAVPNPNVRAQQQQQMFNTQQAQQQMMQHAAQQQSQAAARASAQAKAQQMALQGQPGGMGPGPVPPQQSPAMATLNAPLRTPSQQMNHSDTPQLNASGQFGQPLDPRFMQGNQRPTSQGSLFNPAMLADMPQEHQQRLAGLPQDKLAEVVNRWHEQRALHLSAANPQTGRAPIPMQGSNQFRPGQQVPQPNQFNPQNALNQFMMANPGQRPPQALASGMTAQQQIMLQQQIARLQQNPAQQRNSPQSITPNEQRTIMQMDAMEFPATLRTHAHMPRGVPLEVKKWGALKQWAQQNPAVPPETCENIKGLQKMHFQQLLRARNQQAGQPPPTGILAGGQNVPGTVAMVPPGMSAPVAPMGQNPMLVQNGMNIGQGQIRQPTPLEIQSARSHNGGKMANLTDDQIRAMIIRNQMNQQQQQQQRQTQLMQQMQMANQLSQMSGQQSRPNPGQAGNLIGGVQNPQPQITQVKQHQPAPDASVPAPNPANTARSSRPTPGGRSAAQNPSPAPTSKNLKRASSDDVVEVPNPNTQAQRSTPQQNQAAKPAPQQARPNLTAQQIAQLDPEGRKKYEQAFRMLQSTRALPEANVAKLKIIMEEEGALAREPLADLPMDQETKFKIASLLREMHPHLINMGKAILKWYEMTYDDGRARDFFRTRHRLAKQFKDREMREPKDTFSMTLPQAEEARQLLRGMVQDLSDRFPGLKRPEATQSQSHAEPPQATAMHTQAAVPLNAANLHQQQQQLSKMHQRLGGRNGQTPAAPTSSQPPFPIGVGSPPHVSPSYFAKAHVTQENLHIPARKKVKPNANTPVPGQGTPGSNSSPQVKSPELKRQQATDSKPQTKPSMCCSEPDCERHSVGFESKEELDRHSQEEHIRPLQDPFKYAQENLASVLGLDSQGRSKKPSNPTISQSTTTPGIKMAANNSKQGQTPKTPVGASTPMNRQNSMNRQASTAGSKRTSDSKDSLAKAQMDRKESSKDNQPVPAVATEDPWANTTLDPTELFQAFQGFDAGATGAISDRNVYRSITPNDTPESSKDGLSEPNSDISEGVGLDIKLELAFDDNWQCFGSGDIDGLTEMNDFHFSDKDIIMAKLEKDRPQLDLQLWDDMVDYNKPFIFNTLMYSMNE